MHGSIPLHTVTTTTIESRTFADWPDANDAEAHVERILAAEKANPRRSTTDPEVSLSLMRLVRICQRATCAADPQSRTRVVAHRIPGVRYVHSQDQTIFDLYFSVQDIDRGTVSMSLVRSAKGDWKIVL